MLKAVAPVLLVLCALATPASADVIRVQRCTTLIATGVPILTVCRPEQQ